MPRKKGSTKRSTPKAKRGKKRPRNAKGRFTSK